MLRRRRDFTQKVVCLALLFVMPILISAPAVRQNSLPFDMKSLTAHAPWQQARPDGMTGDETENTNPVITRYYPWYSFLNQAGASGELPLWNPYEGFGAPFFALWRTRALSPFSLPLYAFQLHVAIGMAVFLKMLVAGLCAYYAARRFHFTPSYALLAALSFQMSGVLLIGHWHPASDVMPWLPLLLPCMQRLLLGDHHVWAWLALLFGVMSFGGDPEMLVGIAFFALVLTFTYGLRTYTCRRLTGALPLLVFSLLLGTAISAIQLAPFIEFARHGALTETSRSFFHPRDFSNLIAPVSHANSIDAALWLPAGLVGVLLFPLWLAVRPFANRMRKRRLEAFLLATLLILATAPVFLPYLRRIPGLSLLDVFHFSAPFPLAMGFLAATTADEWIHLNAEKCRRSLKRLAWHLPVLWGVLFAAACVAARPSSPPLASVLASLCVAAILLSLIIVTSFWPQEKLFVFSIIFLTAAFSCWTYAPHTLYTPGNLVFPETSFIQVLHDQNTRVAGSRRLKDWPLSAHGIAQIYSPSGISLARAQQFIRQSDERPELLRLTGAQALLLTRQDVKDKFSALRPIFNIQEVFPSGAILMKDLQACDRARVIHIGRAFDEEHPQPLKASGPALLEGGTLPSSIRENAASEAVITHDSPNTVKISVSSNCHGVLVLADAWYPGWQATVDGAQTPMFPVDIAFRGIEIGEGTHEVVFTYNPFSIKIGAVLTLVGLIATCVGFLALIRNRFFA